MLAGPGLEKFLGVRSDLIIGQTMELFLYFF